MNKSLLILLVCGMLMFSSCSDELDVSGHSSNNAEETSFDATENDKNESAVDLDSIEMLPGKPEVTRVVTAKLADVEYQLQIPLATDAGHINGISSQSEHISIPHIIDEYGIFDLVSLTDVDLPNIKSLTLEEGIHQFQLYPETGKSVTDGMAGLEVLELPASIRSVSCMMDDSLQGMLQTHWLSAEPLLANVGDDWDEIVESLTGYSRVMSVFSPGLPYLKEIRVADGGVFWDEDGMLYANNYVSLSLNTGDYPQKQLICLPQNYQNTENVWIPVEKVNLKMVRIPDGTDYIHIGAVYGCHSFEYLYIPDSVTRIAPAAIVATAEHPLVIRCSRNSVAAQYAEQFGELYHLTVEYVSR